MSQRLLHSIATLAAIATPTMAFMGLMPLNRAALSRSSIAAAPFSVPLAGLRTAQNNHATVLRMAQTFNIPITVTGNNLEVRFLDLIRTSWLQRFACVFTLFS